MTSAKARKRLTIGDVLAVQAGDRLAYVQYIGSHPEYGDAILVSPMLHERAVPVTSDLFADGYVTFYPAKAAANQRLVELIDNLPSPPLPDRLRRAGKRSGGRVDTWIIEDSKRETAKSRFSNDERKLPIAAIWNHALLVQRLVERWDPTLESKDA
jgi:hypothetical protein